MNGQAVDAKVSTPRHEAACGLINDEANARVSAGLNLRPPDVEIGLGDTTACGWQQSNVDSYST